MDPVRHPWFGDLGDAPLTEPTGQRRLRQAAALQQPPQRLREQGPSRYLADGEFMHNNAPGWNGAIVTHGGAVKPLPGGEAEDPKPSELRRSLPTNRPIPKGRTEGFVLPYRSAEGA